MTTSHEHDKRRRKLIQAAAGAGAALVLPMINHGRYSASASGKREYSGRTIALLERTPALGMCNPIGMRRPFHRSPNYNCGDEPVILVQNS